MKGIPNTILIDSSKNYNDRVKMKAQNQNGKEFDEREDSYLGKHVDVQLQMTRM